MRIIPELEFPDLESLDEFRNIFKKLKIAWRMSKEHDIRKHQDRNKAHRVFQKRPKDFVHDSNHG